MNDDLQSVAAERWREIEREYRRDVEVWANADRAAAARAAADYCSLMAEEAEAREKCARGEHEEDGRERADGGRYCRNCDSVFSPMNRPADDPSAEDVRSALRLYASHDLEVFPEESKACYRVLAALIRKTFPDKAGAL